VGDPGRALTDRLYDDGALRDPAWRAVFAAVERHRFVPGRAWTMDAARRRQVLDRAADPDTWMSAAYADAAIVTQVDDGAPDGPGVATSSLSQPTVVAWMLEALGVAPGHRVLEIGTGPGWNAGLLAARAGDANVTTVEVDAALAETARAALAAVGRTPAVVAADGADGYPPNAPYDRVIATCGARTVPYAWVAQARPGGRVLLPWRPAAYAGSLLSLTVAGDGTASGRCGTMLGFMPLRGQRVVAGGPPTASGGRGWSARRAATRTRCGSADHATSGRTSRTSTRSGRPRAARRATATA
jgi:protein-L-isoaspartate O-methyltransferase